jgi:hypothetical protein
LATFFKEEYQQFSSGDAKSNLAVNNLIGAHDHWSVANSMVTEVAEGESRYTKVYKDIQLLHTEKFKCMASPV